MEVENIIRDLEDLVNNVVEGYTDPIQAKILIKQVQTAIEKADKGIKAEVINEVEKYKGKYEGHGAKITLSERRKYDFTGVSSWAACQSVIDEQTEVRKGIEEQLKAVSPSSPYVDAETGEVITAIPSEVTRIVSVTLTK